MYRHHQLTTREQYSDAPHDDDRPTGVSVPTLLSIPPCPVRSYLPSALEVEQYLSLPSTDGTLIALRREGLGTSHTQTQVSTRVYCNLLRVRETYDTLCRVRVHMRRSCSLSPGVGAVHSNRTGP